VHATTYVPEVGTVVSPVAGGPSVIHVKEGKVKSGEREKEKETKTKSVKSDNIKKKYDDVAKIGDRNKINSDSELSHKHQSDSDLSNESALHKQIEYKNDLDKETLDLRINRKSYSSDKKCVDDDCQKSSYVKDNTVSKHSLRQNTTECEDSGYSVTKAHSKTTSDDCADKSGSKEPPGKDKSDDQDNRMGKKNIRYTETIYKRNVDLPDSSRKSGFNVNSFRHNDVAFTVLDTSDRVRASDVITLSDTEDVSGKHNDQKTLRTTGITGPVQTDKESEHKALTSTSTVRSPGKQTKVVKPLAQMPIKPESATQHSPETPEKGFVHAHKHSTDQHTSSGGM